MAHPTPPDRQPIVTVLGVGQMGLVCAGLLSSSDSTRQDAAGHQGPGIPLRRPATVRLWGHDPDEAGHIAQTRRGHRLNGFQLSEAVSVILSDQAAVQDADLIVTAIPVQFTRDVWTRLAPFVAPHAAVLSVAKGIENGTLLRPSQIIAEVLAAKAPPAAGPRRIGCLSGPTIAAELARCLPAAMIAASPDIAFAKDIQTLFGNSWMRVYSNTDLIGVELAGAVKNVIAIAAGVADGLQAGNNAKSALLARGLAEITRLGLALGAQPDTFFGIAGVGDLATSCFSPEGRNRSCGEALGKGEKVAAYLRRTPYVVEGVATTKSVMELARAKGVDMPIVSAVHAVLFEDVDPIEAIGHLMSREQKHERVG